MRPLEVRAWLTWVMVDNNNTFSCSVMCLEFSISVADCDARGDKSNSTSPAMIYASSGHNFGALTLSGDLAA